MSQITNGDETDNECPVCGSASLKIEFAQVVTGQVGGPQEGVELLVCGSCNHVVSVCEAEQ